MGVIRIVPSTPEEVLEFWFALEKPGKKDDPLIRENLFELYEQAAGGQLKHWSQAPSQRLALVLLLDQVPRHLYRMDARAFATDLRAQRETSRFFDSGDWDAFSPMERFYAALPYLHAEDVAAQEQVNPLVHESAGQIESLSFMGRIADLYLETIRRFGYFPHRNTLRGRDDSPEEQRFLETEWHPRRKRAIPEALMPTEG